MLLSKLHDMQWTGKFNSLQILGDRTKPVLASAQYLHRGNSNTEGRFYQQSLTYINTRLSNYIQHFLRDVKTVIVLHNDNTNNNNANNNSNNESNTYVFLWT